MKCLGHYTTLIWRGSKNTISEFWEASEIRQSNLLLQMWQEMSMRVTDLVAPTITNSWASYLLLSILAGALPTDTNSQHLPSYTHCAPCWVSVLHTAVGPQPASPSSYQSSSATCHPLQDASLKANWSPFLLHPLNITHTPQEPPLPGPSCFPFLSTWALQCQVLPSSSSTAASPGLPLNSQE